MIQWNLNHQEKIVATITKHNIFKRIHLSLHLKVQKNKN